MIVPWWHRPLPEWFLASHSSTVFILRDILARRPFSLGLVEDFVFLHLVVLFSADFVYLSLSGYRRCLFFFDGWPPGLCHSAPVLTLRQAASSLTLPFSLQFIWISSAEVSGTLLDLFLACLFSLTVWPPIAFH